MVRKGLFTGRADEIRRFEGALDKLIQTIYHA